MVGVAIFKGFQATTLYVFRVKTIFSRIYERPLHISHAWRGYFLGTTFARVFRMKKTT
jgi:hypothetical protein